jgi:GcrA cell cycle regulator
MSGFWTDERVARLKQLADGTHSASEIAMTLGCSRHTVIGKLFRAKGALGRLPPRPVGEKRRRQARAAPSRPAAVSRVAAARAGAGTAGKPPLAVLAPVPQSKVHEPAVEAPALAPTMALVPFPITFLEAVERGRCLWFAGAAFAPDGPDMPVCGGERSGDPESRYCAFHRARRTAEAA